MWCVFCQHVCPCNTFMSGTQESQTMVQDLLELESQVVVSYHVRAGTQIWVLCKDSQCS